VTVNAHCVSSDECIAALVHAGFEMRERSCGSTTLVRGDELLLVPDEEILSTESLEAVLSRAGLSYERLLELLGEEPTSIEVLLAIDGIG
jgi:hypothetical protein